MRYVVRAAFAALVGGLLLLPASASAQGAGRPKITLSQKVWDFGEVWMGEKVSVKLVIKNEGDAELSITKVHSSCGCTVAQPAKNNIAPGESTECNVAVDTTGKQGKFTSKVIVFSNDPSTREASLDIRGFVKRAVTIDPMGGLVSRSTDASITMTAKVTVQNHESEPLKLELKSNNAPQWDIKINEITPGLTYEVTATTKGPMPRGTTKGALLFTTGLKREPTLNIPVRVQILERVELVPRALLFLKEEDEVAKRSISVEYYGTEDFQVTSATADYDQIKVSVGQARPAGKPIPNIPNPKITVPVALDIPPPNTWAERDVTIKILTNDPEFPELTVLLTSDQAKFQTLQYGGLKGAPPGGTPPPRRPAPPPPAGQKP